MTAPPPVAGPPPSPVAGPAAPPAVGKRSGRRPKPRPRWGCGDIVFGIGAMFLVGIILAVPMAVAGVTRGPWVEVFGSAAVWIGLGGWALYTSWVKGYGSLKIDFGWAFRWYDVFLGFGITVVALVISVGLSLVQQAVGVKSAGNTQFLQSEARSPGWTYVVLTLVVAVGAPIVEELFFRGLTYSAFAKRFGPGVAVLGSSFIFGLLHFQGGALVPTILLLVNITVLGLLLGLARMWSGRTGPGVFAHMFFNLTAALLILSAAGA